MSQKEFAYRVNKYQKGFLGEPLEISPTWGVFHENPHSCICEKVDNTTTGEISNSETFTRVTNKDNDADIPQDPEVDVLLSD